MKLNITYIFNVFFILIHNEFVFQMITELIIRIDFLMLSFFIMFFSLVAVNNDNTDLTHIRYIYWIINWILMCMLWWFFFNEFFVTDTSSFHNIFLRLLRIFWACNFSWLLKSHSFFSCSCFASKFQTVINVSDCIIKYLKFSFTFFIIIIHSFLIKIIASSWSLLKILFHSFCN